MSNYLDALQQVANRNACTENGAITNSTSSDAVLDFFALAGAMRNNVSDAKRLFRAAYAEDRQLAIRALFYLRDIRGGQGERQLFRELFTELRELSEDDAEKVLGFIPEYGRWDDLIAVGEPSLVAEIVDDQLNQDSDALHNGQPVSLLAKWMPSENASSKVSRRKARELASRLGMSNKEYRQRVVALRKRIALLEQKMSAGEWDAIEFDKLPSQAGRKHAKAFKRHDGDRYSAYLAEVMGGTKTMNAGTVATYEVFDGIRNGNSATANALWKSLPDWTNGKNAIVVADVSGSMTARIGSGRTTAMDISTSLALYFAERNDGPFKDYFITFSESPTLVKIRGRNLQEKLRNIETSDWGFSTDIQAVFNLLLNTAVQAKAAQEEMPQTIYIVSDMQFNESTRNAGQTAFENAREMYRQAGYELPTIVFWNVAARDTNTPATKFDRNVTMVSGFSQSTFRYAVENKSPRESMLDILNGERYAQITV